MWSTGANWQGQNGWFKRAPTGDAAWTAAFVSRTSGLSTPQSDAVKAFMNTLATAGLDTKCLMAKIDALPGTNANLNLKSTSYTSTNHIATHTDTVGYIGNGSTAYVDTGFSPATNGGTVNDHSVFVALTNMDYDNGPAVLIDSINYHNVLTALDFGGNLGIFAASGTQLSWANSDTTGSVAYFGYTRSGASAAQVYHNGTQVVISTSNTADGSFDSGNLCTLGGPTSGAFSANTVGFTWFGTGLTSTEHGTLYTAVRTLLHTLNATAFP